MFASKAKAATSSNVLKYAYFRPSTSPKEFCCFSPRLRPHVAREACMPRELELSSQCPVPRASAMAEVGESEGLHRGLYTHSLWLQARRPKASRIRHLNAFECV